MRETKKSNPGFTLVEMVIVIAIIAIIAVVTIPAMTRMNERQKLRGVTRTLLGHIQKTRQMAATGKSDASWAPNEQTVTAYLLFQAQGYQIYIDNDRNPNDGNEVLQEAVSFVGGESHLQIMQPAPGTEIRFARNGTLTTNADETIVIRDTNLGRQEQITVLFGGTARID